ncbi:Ig-like domain-containing protein [Parasediminibacterium sp. JCM 36343]|uniref:Ig-like domain-containing protein n=1 Tax=Parasediminibacterium sp. JCM 36343 TaxID=3374279 RepID=UPI00397AB187
MVKNILLLLLVMVCMSANAQTTLKYKVITTEFSRGGDPEKEYIKLFIYGQKTCSEALGGDSIANISHFVVYDHNGLTKYGNGLPGIASGKYRFPNTPIWDSILYGSVILIYNDKSKNGSIPPSVVDDSTGKIIPNLYVIPISWLENVPTDSITGLPSDVPPRDSILQTPANLILTAGQYCTLTKIISPTYNGDTAFWTSNIANWKQGSANGNESPASFKDPIDTWRKTIQKDARYALNVGITTDEKFTVTPVCPENIVYTASQPGGFVDSSLHYQWRINGLTDSLIVGTDTILNTTKQTTQYSKQNDTITVLLTTSAKCVIGHRRGQPDSTGFRADIPDSVTNTYFIGKKLYPIPDSLKMAIMLDSTPKPLVDTFGLKLKDTVLVRDSSTIYMTFCKDTTCIKFSAVPNEHSITDKYYWYKRGINDADYTLVSTDSVYIACGLKNKDTLINMLNSSVSCLGANNKISTKIILTILDSIAPPTIFISGDTAICSAASDSFLLKVTPNTIGDTSATYTLRWTRLIGGVVSDTLFADNIFKDGDITIKKYNYGPQTFSTGDQVQAVLLMKKYNSCPYDTSSALSNVLTMNITQSIIPVVKIVPTQDGLCPTNLGFKDTIQFNAVTDSISSGTAPKYQWYFNHTVLPNDTLPSYTNYATLTSADTIGVRLTNTTFICAIPRDAYDSMNLKIFDPLPAPSATIDPISPLICQNSTAPVQFTNISNTNPGTHPTKKWYLNNVDVTNPADSAQYIYTGLKNNDSVTFVLTSSVACATPKTASVTIPIVITPNVAPSVSLLPAIDTVCAGTNIIISPTFINGGPPPTGQPLPTFDVYLNNNLIASGISTPTFTIDPNVNPVNDGDALYVVLHSTAPCVVPSDANSDTIHFKVNPVPDVQPISGDPSVCQGAFKLYTDPTPDGIWGVSDPTVLKVLDQASGKILGVIQQDPTATVSGNLLYTVTNPVTGCFKTVSLTIQVTPSDVDTVTGQHTICVGQTIQLALATPLTNGLEIWVSSNPAIATVDINGLVMGIANGDVVIKDSIGNDCGTTVRPFNLHVGPPTVADIAGKTALCTFGDTTTLTNVTPNGTWYSSNPAVASIDPATGLVTAVGFGVTTITDSVTNSCGTASSTPFLFTVGKPVVGPITGNNIVCTKAQDPLGNSTPGGKWTSDNPSIATIDSNTGIATGVSVGTTTIKYKVSNNCGDTTTTFILSVEFAIPVQPIAGDSIVCNGDNITLTHPVAGGTWSTSDSSFATVDATGVVTAAASLKKNGYVTITYALANNCGIIYTAKQLFIGPPIIGAYHYRNPICVNDTTKFTNDTKGATSVKWISTNTAYANFGTSATGDSSTIYGVQATSTPVSILYLPTNGCQGAPIGNSVTITVSALPVIAAITGPDSVCIFSKTAYTTATKGGTWSSYNNAIGTISPTGVVTAVTAGVDTISYTVTNIVTGCSNTIIKAITVNPLPVVARITGTPIACLGRTTILADATIGGVWTSSDPSSAPVNGGVVSGLVANKTAIISYTVTDAKGCVQKADTILSVNPIPNVAKITGASQVCTSSTIKLADATADGVWGSANAAIATPTLANDGTISGVAQGNTNILYTYTLNGCDTTTAFAIQVNTNTAAEIVGISNICGNGLGVTTFTDATPGGTWSTFSKGTIANVDSKTGVVTGVAANGVDTVYYTLNDPTCGVTIKWHVINVGSPIVAEIQGASSVCVNSNIVLTDDSIGGVWTSIPTSIATVDANGKVTGIAAGTATINYTVTNPVGNCHTIKPKTITVNALPTVAIDAKPDSVCVGGTITRTASPASGAWTIGNTTFATINGTSGLVSGLTKGATKVYYTYTDLNACINSDSSALTVVGLPSVAPITLYNPITKNTDSTQHIGLTLNLSSTPPNGVWTSSGNGVSTVEQDGVATGVRVGKDVITYKVTAGGCSSSEQIAIIILDSLNDTYVPNFLYPGSTTVANQTFKVFGVNIDRVDLKIFSQWGQLMYEENVSYKGVGPIAAKGWDGTYKGKPQPVGVYVYVANITTISGEVVTKKGAVNLIR